MSTTKIPIVQSLLFFLSLVGVGAGIIMIIASQFVGPEESRLANILADNNSTDSIEIAQALTIESSSESSSSSILSSAPVQPAVITIDESLLTSSSSLSSFSSSRVDNTSSKSTQSYVNRYLPNFVINYDIGWRLVNTAKPSIYEGLVNRELSFTKGKSHLIIRLTPFPKTGCGETNKTKLVTNKNLSGNLSRFSGKLADDTGFLQYSKSESPKPGCIIDNTIETNIQSGYSSDYKNSLDKGDNVKYLFEITTPGLTFESPESDFEAIDQIIAASKFE